MKNMLIYCFIIVVSILSKEVSAIENESSEQLKILYFDAARKGDIELLKTFYHAGLPVNVANEKGYTALILSAYNGQSDTVDFLLSLENIDPCQEDTKGNTALMGAIFKGNFRIAKALMDADCEVDQSNLNGQTALMFATLFNRQEIIDELIDKGANITLTDNSRLSLSDIAAGQGNHKLVERFTNQNP